MHVSALDLAQALAIARRKVPGLDALESAKGHVWLTAKAVLAGDWQAEIDVTKSSGALKLRSFLGRGRAARARGAHPRMGFESTRRAATSALQPLTTLTRRSS